MVNPLLLHWALLSLCIPFASSTTSVTVDDADPSIVYTGTWVEDVPSEALDKTLRYSRVPGSTATFFFTGIQVRVYGSFGPNRGPPFQVAASFDIGEGQPISSYNNSGPPDTTEFRLLVYSSPVLPMGEHTLIMTNNADYFWIDYFVYDVADAVTTSTAPQPPSTASLPPLPPPSISEATVASSATPSQPSEATPSQPSEATPSQPSEATPIISLALTSTPTVTVVSLQSQIESTNVGSAPPPNTSMGGFGSPPQSTQLSSTLPLPLAGPGGTPAASNPGPPTAPHPSPVQGNVSSNGSGRSRLNTAAIVGAVAGFLALVLAALTTVLVRRRRKRMKAALRFEPYTSPGTDLAAPDTSFWDTMNTLSRRTQYRQRLYSQTSLPLTPMGPMTSRSSVYSYHDGPAPNPLSEAVPSSVYPYTQDGEHDKTPYLPFHDSQGNGDVFEPPVRERDGGIQLHVVGINSLIITDDSQLGLENGVALPPAYGDVPRPSRPQGTWVFQPASDASV